MRGRAAIGIDDDLAPGQPGIPVRAADLECAGRIDVPHRLVRQPPFGQDVGHGGFHIVLELGFLFALVIALGMLRRDDDRRAGDGLAVIVAQGELAFRIRFEERGGAGLAILREAVEDLVAVIERSRHQVGRLVGGVTEHDALVPGAFVLVAAGIDALRDFARLTVEMVLQRQRFVVETVLLVSDLAHRAAHGRLDLVLGAFDPVTVFVNAAAPDFAGENHALRRGQSLAGDARFGVFRQEQIDDGIGNLVGHLVRVAFGNGFGSEQESVAHQRSI